MIPLPPTSLVLKAAPWLVAGLVSGVGWRVHDANQQTIGAQRVLLQQDKATITALEDRLKYVVPRIAHVDTVVRHDVATVTRTVTQLAHDTAWVHDTLRIAGDTTLRVAVPMATVDSARSALSACQALAVDCTTQRQLLGTQVALLTQEAATYRDQVKLTQSAVPSGFSRWSGRLLAAGAGFGLAWIVKK